MRDDEVRISPTVYHHGSRVQLSIETSNCHTFVHMPRDVAERLAVVLAEVLCATPEEVPA